MGRKTVQPRWKVQVGTKQQKDTSLPETGKYQIRHRSGGGKQESGPKKTLRSGMMTKGLQNLIFGSGETLKTID